MNVGREKNPYLSAVLFLQPVEYGYIIGLKIFGGKPMPGFRFSIKTIILFILSALSLTIPGRLEAQNSSPIVYEALSPWGDADPKPLKGISERLSNLSGKKIGIFANYKRAAMPIASSLKDRIKESYPDAEVSIYHSDKWNVIEIETEKKDEFKKWVESNDAFILLVGD